MTTAPAARIESGVNDINPSSRLSYDIAQRLKELRAALGYDQAQMAEKFGMSHERYRKCEAASASPPSHFAIVQAVHNIPCSANYLLVGWDDNPAPTQEKIAAYRKEQKRAASKRRLKTVK